jgi:tRNA 2-thiouridine synthesizing protein E
MQDWKAWTPEIASAIAQTLGMTLGDDHWRLIEFARKEYERTSTSPNIRRLTTGTGLSTKLLYQIFPKAPGKSTAMVSGLPKPAGCI